MTTAATEALSIHSGLSDFGVAVKLEVHSDATAAIGICKRQGLGRVRHLATADLWIQHKIRSRVLKLFKLPCKDNPSGLMTKHKAAPEASRFLSMLGIKRFEGLPALASSRVPRDTHPATWSSLWREDEAPSSPLGPLTQYHVPRGDFCPSHPIYLRVAYSHGNFANPPCKPFGRYFHTCSPQFCRPSSFTTYQASFP